MDASDSPRGACRFASLPSHEYRFRAGSTARRSRAGHPGRGALCMDDFRRANRSRRCTGIACGCSPPTVRRVRISEGKPAFYQRPSAQSPRRRRRLFPSSEGAAPSRLRFGGLGAPPTADPTPACACGYQGSEQSTQHLGTEPRACPVIEAGRHPAAKAFAADGMLGRCGPAVKTFPAGLDAIRQRKWETAVEADLTRLDSLRIIDAESTNNGRAVWRFSRPPYFLAALGAR